LAQNNVKAEDNSVGGTPHLAVASMLAEKAREPVPSQLCKHRESRLEAVFPIHGEAEAIRVKGPEKERGQVQRKKGDRSNLAERPEDCFAKIRRVSFFDSAFYKRMKHGE
jgi:hypothetical protein